MYLRIDVVETAKVFQHAITKPNIIPGFTTKKPTLLRLKPQRAIARPIQGSIMPGRGEGSREGITVNRGGIEGIDVAIAVWS